MPMWVANILSMGDNHLFSPEIPRLGPLTRVVARHPLHEADLADGGVAGLAVLPLEAVELVQFAEQGLVRWEM